MSSFIKNALKTKRYSIRHCLALHTKLGGNLIAGLGSVSTNAGPSVGALLLFAKTFCNDMPSSEG